MNIDIRSQRGEDVCEFIWLAVAAYDKSELGSRNLVDWRDVANSNRSVLTTISEIAGHVEVFVVESLIEHAELVSSASLEPIPKIVMTAVKKPVQSTWKERQNFIKAWLGETVSSDSWWRRWLGFVEARNAWAHGLGRLTARQDTNEVRGYLHEAGLALDSSGVIIATSADVRRCAKAAVEVVDWIDRHVRRE